MKRSTFGLLFWFPFVVFAQTAYKDSAYLQDYSVKYEKLRVRDTATLQMKKVVCDRNGVIQVLSSEGVLRPSGGALLYPGELSPDKTYRYMLNRSIKDIILYERQFVYLDDTAVLSNAWAGKLYLRHKMPAVSQFAGGPEFSFLLADGPALQYRKDRVLLWEGRSDEPVLAIQWDSRSKLFRILGEHGVYLFDPSVKKLRVLYKGHGLTCMEAMENSDQIIVGTHAGYFMLDAVSGLPVGEIHARLPEPDLRVIRRIGGKTWFGSVRGAFVQREDGKFDYYASHRWLPSNMVVDISAGPNGAVLILTNRGLGEIHFDRMTLYDKAMYYERQVRDRHIRFGFNSMVRGMKDGNLADGNLRDSDNDGLWTSMYLGGEVFRYAATKSPEALQNCRESLDAMERLYTVNAMKGFPSRSFERSGYEMGNVEVWRKSAYREWDWKSTTSSDEAIGHVFVYGAIAELVDDTAVRNKAIRLLDTLMSHIVGHNMYLIDWNGQPTTWGRWNPEYVNALPVMVGDRKINSSNIIAMLQTAYHFTGRAMYKDKAFELMNKYGYLDNLMRPFSQISQAPSDADALSKRLSGGWNHSDDEMYFLGYWGLYRYALNDTLREKFKAAILDHWQMERPEKEGAWNIFTAITGTPQFDLDASVWYLQQMPMDMIDWAVSNSQRKDIVPMAPNFRKQTLEEVLPPDELPMNKHNANRFNLDNGGWGGGGSEHSAGDIWLLPYWMGRWLQVISAPVQKQPLAQTEPRYKQTYSIKYKPAKDGIGGFRTVIADRNNVTFVLSDSGVLRPQDGRLLYPGTLQRDRLYKPLLDRKISGICLYDQQVVYLDDSALFSNAWAGKLYAPHNIPGAHLLSGGAGRRFLISDGRQLALIGDSVLWTGTSTAPLLAIRYDILRDLFLLLSDRSIATFSPSTKEIKTVYEGSGLTCLLPVEDKIVLGTHDGYIELDRSSYRVLGDMHRRLPATDLTVIEEIGGHVWYGSTHGAFTLQNDTSYNYYASERWLPGDKVTGIASGPDSAVLILTDKGLGKICSEWMTLEEKARYYEEIVRQRHIRYGFYSDLSGLSKGEVSTAVMGPHDSDNLWTSMYLVGELFRYLTTHEAEARQNYNESFDAMERLFTLSGIPGLFGRCIERRGIVEFKEEYRKNIEAYWYPGYARTPSSWHHSPDSAWDWRGSASSDQAVGQFFALTLVAQYSDDEALRKRAIRLIDQLVGYIVDNGLKLVDVNGRPTLWGLWGPEYVNRFPNMVGDKKLYSSNIIAFLQTAYHFTGKKKYKDKAMELLYKYHYLQNLTRPVREIGPAPATADKWSQELSGGWNNSDDEMYFLAYWGLYPYALDKKLQAQYGEAIRDHWQYKRTARDGLWNLSYGVITGAAEYDVPETVWQLQRMPMDLIGWPVHNSDRKDIEMLPENIRNQYVRDVLPPDERPQQKHNRNLFELDEKNGNGGAELGGGDVYLLPYWMGRYFGAFDAHASKAHASGESFNVKSFGAVGDGLSLDSRAINAAIETAASAGGGTVYVPAGHYLCGSIRLKSNIHLQIDQGAILIAAEVKKENDYDEEEPGSRSAYQDRGHSHWHNSLIWGENVHDVSITGAGLIWGKGLYKGGAPGKQSANKAIALVRCRNVIIRDISILHGGWFGILATGTDNFTLDNVKMDTNRDGVDVDCCHNVRISNCMINSPYDDGICLKSSFALDTLRSTENVTITNCQVSGYDEGTLLDGSYQRTKNPKYGFTPTGRIKMGTESNGGFRNITISNCVFDYCEGLALETVDGAILEDVSITNITMRDMVEEPIFLRLGARLRGPQGTQPGALRRVMISNVVVYNSNAENTCTISGIPGHQIEDVQLSNINVYYQGGGMDTLKADMPEAEAKYPEPGMFGDCPVYGLYVRHASNIRLNDITFHYMKADARPPFEFNDVCGLYMRHVDAQREAGVKPMILKAASDVIITGCAGLPETGLAVQQR